MNAKSLNKDRIRSQSSLLLPILCHVARNRGQQSCCVWSTKWAKLGPSPHYLQARILRSLLAAESRPELYFEMMSTREEKRHDVSRRQKELDDRERGLVLEWEKRGWPVWEAYAPLFLLADHQTLHVRHANLTVELIENIRRFGLFAIPLRLRRQMFPPKNPLNLEQLIKAIEISLMESHNIEKQSPYLTGLVFAQIARNAYMALQLSRSDGPAVLIAGIEHVRTDCAAPVHLKSIAPELNTVSIGFVASENYGNEPNGYNPDNHRESDHFDYIWIMIGDRDSDI